MRAMDPQGVYQPLFQDLSFTFIDFNTLGTPWGLKVLLGDSMWGRKKKKRCSTAWMYAGCRASSSRTSTTPRISPPPRHMCCLCEPGQQVVHIGLEVLQGKPQPACSHTVCVCVNPSCEPPVAL